MSAMASLVTTSERYVHWGVIQISVTNLAIIAVMLLLFVLAVVVPFPSGHHHTGPGPRS